MDIETVIFLCVFSFNYGSGGETLNIQELNYELKLLQTELLLFTDESTFKDKLIVRDILELERSLIKIQTMLNNTAKTNRDVKGHLGNIVAENGKDIIKRLNALEKNTQILQKANTKKDDLIEKLNLQVYYLQHNFKREKVQRLGLEKEIDKLKALANNKEL